MITLIIESNSECQASSNQVHQVGILYFKCNQEPLRWFFFDCLPVRWRRFRPLGGVDSFFAVGLIPAFLPGREMGSPSCTSSSSDSSRPSYREGSPYSPQSSKRGDWSWVSFILTLVCCQTFVTAMAVRRSVV